jgi:serine/threonine-protein kinase
MLFAAVDRITNSRSFEGADRLKRFLRFVVSETVAGRGSHLKEYVIGEQVFDKGAAFEPRIDPIVRVQASRLRVKLALYRAKEGRNDGIIIELPKGSYAPVFRTREVDPQKIATVLLERNSVIVLPFEPQSDAPSLTDLCEGITQEVIRAIVQLEGLVVTVCNRMLSNTELRACAAILVHGNLERFGDNLRIGWQLIEGTSGNYLWSESETYSEWEDTFDLEDKTAESIANTIRGNWSDCGYRCPNEQLQTNPAAENFYLQGRYQMEQRTEAGLLLSVSYFKRAIAEDSRFAKAHAGLADAYELLRQFGVRAPVEVSTKAESTAELAIRLDDSCAEAHTALAHVRSMQQWDWEGAEREFLRALELDPHSPTAHHWYAVSCLAPSGRLDKALDSMHVARALAPLSCIIACDFARIHHYRGQYEFAIEQCHRAIELNPHFSHAYWMLGTIEERHREFSKAEAAYNKAIQLCLRDSRSRSGLARIFAITGKQAKARELLDELRRLLAISHVSPWEIASIRFALGEEEAGFTWLKRAFKDRSFELLNARVDPQFDQLKKTPVFRNLVQELGFP